MGERRGTKALELWCRRMTEGYSGVRIDNMTTSWRNGMAFCALVHRFRPDLIDFDKLNAADVYYNNELAFRVAEAQLGIPALLDAADMASYEVPDRLSILTYLSQYYQAFAASAAAAAAAHQDSTAARLNKRPSAGSDGSKANNSGPPAKQLAHPIAGMPKREPCARCDCPVFLAERLKHNGLLYHRTCMRCARCQTQLTPGSFYETEVDGEFCCETCPDEERTADETSPKSQTSITADGNNPHKASVSPVIQSDDAEPVKLRTASILSDAEREAARQSFSQRLALFQNRVSGVNPPEEASKGLLAKSLSDEEKSKSLKRLSALYAMHAGPATRESSVRASFVRRQLEAQNDRSAAGPTAEKSNEVVDDEDDEDGDDDEEESDASDSDDSEPPALPAVEPPPLKENLSPVRKSIEIVLQKNVESTVEPLAKVHDDSNAVAVLDEIPISLSERIKVTPQIEELPESQEESKLPEVQTSPGTSQTTTNDESIVEQILPVDPAIVHEPLINEKSLSEKAIDESTIANVPPMSNVCESPPVVISQSNSTDSDTIIETIKIESPDESLSTINCDDNQAGKVATTIDKSVPVVFESPAIDRPTPMKRSSKSARIAETASPIAETASPIAESASPIKPVATQRRHVPPADAIADEAKESPPADVRVPDVPTQKPIASPANSAYPDSFNPFGDEDDDDAEEDTAQTALTATATVSLVERRKSFNPFDSSDDEIELDKLATLKAKASLAATSSRRQPMTNSRVSLNPFGSDDDDDEEVAGANERFSTKRTPVPTPRKVLYPSGTPTSSQLPSIQNTPEPARRLSRVSLTPGYGTISAGASPLQRNALLYGSTSSLASTASALNAYTRRYKKRAPLPPGGTPNCRNSSTSLLLSPASQNTTGASSVNGSPSESGRSTPTRKKRPAPKPPTPAGAPAELSPDAAPSTPIRPHRSADDDHQIGGSELLLRSPSPALQPIPGSPRTPSPRVLADTQGDQFKTLLVRKLIPLDDSLLDDLTPRKSLNNLADASSLDDGESLAKSLASQAESDSLQPVVYRRTIMPIASNDDDDDDVVIAVESHDRQWQKVKENKESLNKNRQSQGSASSPESNASNDTANQSPTAIVHPNSNGSMNGSQGSHSSGSQSLYSNKSTFGKWKRRKADAPPPPLPPASTASITIQEKPAMRGGVPMLPLHDIRYELEVIEVQQQGLEKQGIQLEKMIRERCEGSTTTGEQCIEKAHDAPNTKEVEDLILELFEIVNEKNGLFRRQAELMYLRRLHRLEQEQAEIEYDIRMLMEQPESNKTDSDKTREDALIARKIEIVLQRNEVIDCLECDRLREAEEDQSIKTRLDEHNARWDEELFAQQLAPAKLSKKEKKKIRETKKLAKLKKMDADKDADDTEVKTTEKKKKRKFLNF